MCRAFHKNSQFFSEVRERRHPENQLKSIQDLSNNKKAVRNLNKIKTCIYLNQKQTEIHYVPENNMLKTNFFNNRLLYI